MAIDIRFDIDSLDITLSGKDRFFAMHKAVSIPMSSVLSARIDSRQSLIEQLAVRMRGSSIPGRVVAGRYSVWPHARVEKGDRQFWMVYHAADVLVIETALSRPRRIVLETPDRQRIVHQIEEAAALAREVAAKGERPD